MNDFDTMADLGLENGYVDFYFSSSRWFGGCPYLTPYGYFITGKYDLPRSEVIAEINKLPNGTQKTLIDFCEYRRGTGGVGAEAWREAFSGLFGKERVEDWLSKIENP